MGCEGSGRGDEEVRSATVEAMEAEAEAYCSSIDGEGAEAEEEPEVGRKMWETT